MRQRQFVCCVAAVVSKLMLVLEVGAIRWKFVPTPDELEILSPFFLRELLKHLPEPLEDFLVFATIVLGNALQFLNCNKLLTTRSGLNFFPGQKLKDT